MQGVFCSTEEKFFFLSCLSCSVFFFQYHCTQSEYLGGRNKVAYGDGAYDLCTEKQFWPFPDEKSKTKCLVYSFGIANDFTFDDVMAKRGCEVHSFDPSESIFLFILYDFRRTSKLSFSQILLSLNSLEILFTDSNLNNKQRTAI